MGPRAEWIRMEAGPWERTSSAGTQRVRWLWTALRGPLGWRYRGVGTDICSAGSLSSVKAQGRRPRVAVRALATCPGVGTLTSELPLDIPSEPPSPYWVSG